MPCGFGTGYRVDSGELRLVGRLGEWIGRLVRPWFPMSRALRVPKSTNKEDRNRVLIKVAVAGG